MLGSSSSGPRKNAKITNNWPLQLTSDNDPTLTYDELNRVDILPDGRVHISAGPEEIANRDELQCRGSSDKVLKWYRWITVYSTLKKLVDGMGFADFCSINAGNSDNRLIHALMERWWPSTHTFHFPCGELGFTPLDFVMLTGISFGRGRELPYDERYSKLEEAEKMFPGITSSDMRYGYLAALTDYDIIGASGFDWGTPIMAALYRGLNEVSVLKPGKVKKSITGFYVVLEYWFFEYYRVGMYLVKRYNKIEGHNQHRLTTIGQVYEIETSRGKHCKITEFLEGSIGVSPIRPRYDGKLYQNLKDVNFFDGRDYLVPDVDYYMIYWRLVHPNPKIGCTIVKRTGNIWSVGRDLVRPDIILSPTLSLATSSQVQDYGVQETDDPRDMEWFMDVAGLNDQRRWIPIPVMHVSYPCLPAYSMDEL
ncbi:hypothetical protein GIB67_038511 [Kingdonia uniflora]|uniref:Aminotransferase-like plant mobile domain-containing protein n=1 Tax=Kingdonia uniflora TaxID=39325 RepID=A0A7J7NPW2_9MAGN|nr:hypothetical protein GIB67_038511 [Kingdonia uniflora]